MLPFLLICVHPLQIDFRLAKQGWMKDFAGKWTIQPLNEHDSKYSPAGDNTSKPIVRPFVLPNEPNPCIYCIDGRMTACGLSGTMLDCLMSKSST